jgi:hypothetical protein
LVGTTLIFPGVGNRWYASAVSLNPSAMPRPPD